MNADPVRKHTFYPNINQSKLYGIFTISAQSVNMCESISWSIGHNGDRALLDRRQYSGIHGGWLFVVFIYVVPVVMWTYAKIGL